jgi:hypothetical protein
LSRADLQPVIDKILNKMASWNSISSMACRLALLVSVIFAMPVFQIMAVHPPAWFIKRIGKAARGFLWANKDVAMGVKCLVNWRQVCSPKIYGGLGIPDIAARSVALRCRWLWQAWMDNQKPWAGLPLPIDERARSLFEASTIISVGDGKTAQFWTDKWHAAGKLSIRFPDLFKLCTLCRISLHKALERDKWVKHFKEDLTPAAIRQFTCLWNLCRQVQLLTDVPDRVTWRWTADGAYSAGSAYAQQFIGSIRPEFTKIIWGSQAPPKCRLFAWLAVQGRCLTADVLAIRGCPHDPLCSLCNNSPETASHLLINCHYAQTVWRMVIARARLPLTFAPNAHDNIKVWLCNSDQLVGANTRKDWRALVPLIWWCIWKERNNRIFRHTAAPVTACFQSILTEARDWADAGRGRVSALLIRPREPD